MKLQPHCVNTFSLLLQKEKKNAAAAAATATATATATAEPCERAISNNEFLWCLARMMCYALCLLINDNFVQLKIFSIID